MISGAVTGFKFNRKKKEKESPIPPAQRMFPEGLRVCHLPNHGSASKVFNSNQFLSFEMWLDFLYFLEETRNKK